MQDLMSEQMAKTENVERPSWLSDEKGFTELSGDLQRNLNKLAMAVREGDVQESWRRAANVGNFAWMIAARLENSEAQVAADDKA
jgi:hypothetical protein